MANASPRFHIRSASSPQDILPTRDLFTAYASSLAIDLSFQNFAHELASLPGLYAPPTGAIFLAFLGRESNFPPSSDLNLSSTNTENETGDQDENKPVGVIALRPLPNQPDSTKCEIKRLYLSPSSRGLGIGKALVEEVINEAKRLQYEQVRLDTLPSMVSARRLYEGVGFKEVAKYYDSPIEGTVFLGLDLRN